MTDVDDRPLITLALQTEVPSGRRVWNLHTAAGDLVGWTHELPSTLVAAPGCWQYGTGDHLAVAYAPGFNTVALPQ